MDRGTMAVMPFGAYKGRDLEDVPDTYLHWLLDQNWFLEKFENLSNVVQEELDWRKQWGRHTPG